VNSPTKRSGVQHWTKDTPNTLNVWPNNTKSRARENNLDIFGPPVPSMSVASAQQRMRWPRMPQNDMNGKTEDAKNTTSEWQRIWKFGDGITLCQEAS